MQSSGAEDDGSPYRRHGHKSFANWVPEIVKPRFEGIHCTGEQKVSGSFAAKFDLKAVLRGDRVRLEALAT